MANAARGELTVHIGGQTRTLRFRTAELMLLEDRLGMDAIGWLGAQKGMTKFLVESVFAGLSKTEKKLTPMRVATWFDDDEAIKLDSLPITRDELAKQILYAIARGKPKEEAVEMVKALDEAFGHKSEDGPGPLGDD